MNRLKHFLSILTLGLCLMLPASGADARLCLSDCDAMTDQEAASVAKNFLYGAKDQARHELYRLADYSYCSECSNNVAKITTAGRNLCYANCEKTGGSEACTQQCKRATDELIAINKTAQGKYTDSAQDNQDLIEAANVPGDLIVGAINEACYRIVVAVNDSQGKAIAGSYGTILARFLSGGSSGCWFCPIFEKIFYAINELATNVYNKLRYIFLSLLALGAFGWLLWTVFKFITTLHGPNIGEFMTTIFKGLGTTMLVAILLAMPVSFATSIFIEPFALMGAGLSRDMLSVGDFDSDTSSGIKYTQYRYEAGCWGEAFVGEQRSMTICKKNDPSKFAGKALSVEVFDTIDCVLRRMSVELVQGIALGAAIVVEAFRSGTLGTLIPDISMLLVGALILLIYLMLYVTIPFKMIDILLKFGFLVIVFPLLMVCFVFPATRSYTKKGFDLFLSCCLTLVALCLFISFALQLVNMAWL